MTIRMHRSTDLGAPVMTGQQGKMNALLLEALCKGIPSAAPTSITQTGGLATCSMTAHKFLSGQTVSIYGATQPEYNGNQVITVVDANTFTFAVPGATATPATGTISVGGQKTIGTPTSITRVGTTVTVVLTAHGLVVGNRAFIQGAAQPEYNGWQTLATQADANTFTFELPSTQTPVTPATGTITVRYGEAGLGWSRPFTTTNRSVFKQGISGTRNQYVVVADETNAGTHTYGVGMHGAEGASAVSTLINKMDAAEAITYRGMFKSGTADTTARKWVIIGDHRTFIILVKPVVPSTQNLDGWHHSYFGDGISYLPGDNYPGVASPALCHSSYNFASLSTYMTQYTTSSGGNAFYFDYAFTQTVNEAYQTTKMTRNHLGAVGNVHCIPICVGNCLNMSNNGVRAQYSLGDRNVSYSYDTYPDPVHGGINLEKIYLTHGTGADNTGTPVVRGELRGLWNPGHRRTRVSTWTNNDTFNGSGELAGKVFEIFDLVNTGAWLVLETSDTWSV